MNKYYIRKCFLLGAALKKDQFIYGLCIRFEKIEPIKMDNKRYFKISNLSIIANKGFLISDNKKGLKVIESQEFEYETYLSLREYNENVFEFETDEDALLYFEVMENE